jgi:hypothetical protein
MHPQIMALNAAVAAEYKCRPTQVPSCNYNGPAKDAAVFVLAHYLGFTPRDIGTRYSMNCLYVPTVVKKAMDMYAISESFRQRVHRILNAIEGYENTV